MILYLDTSALVKAYVNETRSHEVLKAIKKAKIVATHLIAFVEAEAAFSRVKHENVLTQKQYDSVKTNFNIDWENYLHVEITPPLLNEAADIAEAFSLRAYDSMHLAAANMLLKQSKQPVAFGCFDKQLNKAASILGMSLMI